MPFLDIVSPEPSFRHTVLELAATSYGKTDLLHAEHSLFSEAATKWKIRPPELAVIDVDAIEDSMDDLPEHGRGGPNFFFLLIGETERKFVESIFTEIFKKPVKPGHLLSRLNFYVQVMKNGQKQEINFGPWTFLPRERRLVDKKTGKNVTVTDKESSLLECLCLAPYPLPRNEILATVWGYSADMETHTLETHISRLRRKLEDADPSSFLENPFLVENGSYRIHPLWLEK